MEAMSVHPSRQAWVPAASPGQNGWASNTMSSTADSVPNFFSEHHAAKNPGWHQLDGRNHEARREQHNGDGPPSRPPPSFLADRPRPEAGEYGSRTIAKQMGGIDAHSFMVQNTGQIAEEHKSRRIQVPDDPNASIVATLYHRDANPSIDINPDGPETYEIWTRHNFACVKGHMDKSLPFFHFSDSAGSQALWSTYHSSFYAYKGDFKIVKTEVVKGGSAEVLSFVERRGESQRRRTAEAWRAMLNNDWLKVTIVKDQDSIHQNPMVLSSNAIYTSRAPSQC